MVVRIFKYGFAVLSSLLAAVLVLGLWLVWSPSGSAWLLAALFERSPVEISADHISGRLADELQLDGLRVHWPGGTAVVGRTALNWSFVRLFSGELNIAELAVADVDILLEAPSAETSGPAEPFVFRWPQLSGWPLQVTADIAALNIDRLVIRSPEETLWQSERLRLAARWSGGALAISELELASPEIGLAGHLVADLLNSRLAGELQIVLGESIAGVERAALKFDLAAASDSTATVGQLEALLYDAQKAWFDVVAPVELSGETLQVSNGEIRFPGHPDRLLVQGSAQLGNGLPWKATVGVEHLDLSELAGVPLLLFGELEGEGDVDEYRGRAVVENRVDGWLKSRLAGFFDGDLEQIGFTGLAGQWLGGRVNGDLNIGWFDGFSLRSTAQGRELDLAGLFPEWPGLVNLDLRTELQQSGDAPLAMHFSGELLDSTLHGKALAGGVDVRLQGAEVDIARLDLHGEGIDLTAAGRLSRRLDFTASASRLSGLLPGLDGRMDAKGWVNLAQEEIYGSLAVQGSGLRYAEFSLDRLAISAEKPVGDSRYVILAEGQGGMAGDQPVESLSLALQGRPEAHGVTLDALTDAGRGEVEFSGGYQAGHWSGELTEVRLAQTPFGDWALAQHAALQFDAGSLQLAPLKLVSPLGEAVELDGVMTLGPLGGVAQLQWNALRLSHADPWLDGWAASGTTSGDLQLHLQDRDLLELFAEVRVAGGLAKGEQQLDLAGGLLTLDWDRRGLSGQARADFGDMGELTAEVRSPEPARQAFPAAGDFSVRFDGLSLSRLYPWGPEALDAEGTLSGSAAGGWANGADLFLEGKAEIGGGRLKWQEDEGTLAAELHQAAIGWNWRGDSLSGDAVVVLNNHGRLQGEFQLPLPARWPVAIEPEGAVRGALSGYLQEKGLLTSLFPGSVRETSGQLDFDWTLGGTWAQPDLGGPFSLAGASAYLPAAGVQLKDVGFKGRLAADRILLDAFSMKSGSGRLEGSGEVQLADWLPKAYQFKLGGKNFQLVNLPELQLKVNPDLQLSGDRQQVKLRGSVTIPEALIAARNAPSPVASSPDLIIVDAEAAPPPRALPVALDARVRILMGDHVLVKANGIDARLGGEVELQATALDEVTAQGKIYVVEGAYSAYGLGLNIERGNVFFAGGPVDRPTLDILALRKAGEVKAGVQVTGTPRHPVAKLYSEPMMPDTDILAYIVLGRPLGSDSGQSALLMTAAGALLSKGESAVLQDRLKRRLGLDVLEVQAGNGDVTSSVVTIGKYLSPKLYVSLGHALFTSTNEFRMRYTLTDRWELESNVGLESGADLYYRIEFD
ncbi:translocation/assembly module TamB domain-containing protein [Trichloromonas sp.]|uniref:translocation/assembly module TamB domain-containing protein n=1 Tax=Trichloromonas sp. TaxID=3069249 RepID=UPI003D817E7D